MIRRRTSRSATLPLAGPLLGSSLVLFAAATSSPAALAFSPTDWVAGKLASVVGKATGYTVSIGEFDVDLLTRRPTVRLRGVDVAGDELPGLVEGADLSVTIDLKALATGDLVVGEVKVSEADVLLRREADGSSTWSSAPTEPAAEDEDGEEGAFEVPAIERLSIENVTVRVEDEPGARQATLQVEAGGSTTASERPPTVRIDGEVNGEDAALDLVLPSLTAGQTLEAGVALQLDAALGEIAATLDGTVGNPLAGQDVAFETTLDAESLDALETLLGREFRGLAPIELDASVRTEGEAVILDAFSLSTDAVAATGEARLERGVSPPSLQATFDVPTLDVDALLVAFGGGPGGEGPSAMEEAAAEASDAVAREAVADASVAAESGDGGPSSADPPFTIPFTVDDLFGTVHGSLAVDVGRIVGDTVPLGSLSLSLELDADEAALALAGDVEGARATTELSLTPLANEGGARAGIALVLDAGLGTARAEADGRIGDLASLRDIELDASVAIDELAALESALGQELPPGFAPSAFDLRVRSEGEEIVIERVALDADALVAEGSGRLDPTAEPPSVQGAFTVPAIDLDALTAMFGDPTDEANALAAEAADDVVGETDAAVATSGPGTELPFATARLFDTVHGEITLDVVKIDSETLPLDSLAARLELAADAATLALDGNVEGDGAGGDLDGEGAEVSLALRPLGERPDTGLGVDLRASVGGATTELAGSVGDIAALREVDLEGSLDVDDLAVLEALLGRELPALAPLDVDGSVLSDGDELVVRRFDLSAPGVLAEGDLRADPGTAPPTLYANVIVPRLDVDALREAFGVAEPPAELVEEAAEEIDAPPGPRLLPDEPLPFAPLFATVQGAVALRVEEIAGGSLLVDALDTRLELDPERATLTLEEVRVARGTLEGRIALDPREPAAGAQPDAVPVAADIELALAGIDVTRVVRKADLPEEAAEAGGRLGANVRLWSEGASVAELAAGLDGGILALMSGGDINAVFIELAGIDLFQSLGDLLVPGEEEVPIRCAYADLQSEGGVLRLDRFVLDTEDTVFLAEGEVDFGTEALALTVEPHPKDTSLIAASTAVELGGTLAAPEFGVGDSIPVRAAAAAALALVATPALALLPLVEVGGGEDSPFCKGLDGALER